MYPKTLIAVSILVSSVAYAEATEQSTSGSQAVPVTKSTAKPAEDSMSKNSWLDTIVPMLPSLICKGFMGDAELKQRLDSIKMTYDQCISVIPKSVDKCKTQLYASMPEQINNTDAATWGKNLGECIGKDFAMQYLLPKS